MCTKKGQLQNDPRREDFLQDINLEPKFDIWFHGLMPQGMLTT